MRVAEVDPHARGCGQLPVVAHLLALVVREALGHRSKKCNQWYFGMKAHIGVDADPGLVHTVRGTAGNVNDVVEANRLVHGEETEAWGDAGYQGAAKRPDAKADVR